MLEQKEPSFKDLLGVSHVVGRTDCLWLVRVVFSRYGIIIPEYNVARRAVENENYDKECVGFEISKNLDLWKRVDVPEIPSLIVMSIDIPDVYHHVGVIIGSNKFIHNSSFRGKVTIERLDNSLYAKRKYYRFNKNNSN